MKRYLIYLIPLLASLVLVSGLVVGCEKEARPTSTIQPDISTKTQDEVCALVYNYLENKASAMAVPYRMNLLDQLNKARPYSQAVYQGDKKWQVLGLGYGVQINLDEYKKNFDLVEIQEIEAASADERDQWVKSQEQWFLEQHFPSNLSGVKTGVYRVYYYRGGLWNVYETSSTVEPANDQASELLFFIQRWIK